MPIRDLFRPKREPEWRSPDVNVRLAAVRQIGSEEQDLLRELAKDDPAPPVRRAALRKIPDVGVVASYLTDEKDETVREEIYSMLVAVATSNADLAAVETAMAALQEPRHVALVAKAAVLEPVRRAALARVADAKFLGQVARDAEDTEIRLQALARIEDTAVLGHVATGSEHKDVALAALERLTDPEALKLVAARARSKAAARRARTLLESLAPADATPSSHSPHERRRQQLRLCETLETMARSSDWTRLSRELADSETTWAEHGQGAEAAVATRYEAARHVLAARAAAHEKEIAEAEAKQREREGRLSARVDLCTKAEAAAGGDTSLPVDELRTSWDRLEKTDDAEASALATRFDQALAKARARQEAEAAAAAVRPQAEALCLEAEAAADEADPREATNHFKAIERRWHELHTGHTASPELTDRLRAAGTKLKERQALSKAERDKLNQDNAVRLEAVCVQIEKLAAREKPNVRDADKALRETREVLDNLGPLASKEQREAFAARLKQARQMLYPKVQELKDAADWQRFAHLTILEELCGKVEAMAAREDVEVIAHELRDIDTRWKQASAVPKDKGDALWKRFQTAREPLRARCDAFFAARAAEHAENVKKKEALCAKAEALSEKSDWVKTAQEVQALQAEWKTIGPMPRATSNALWERFHKACDTFFTRRKQDRTQRKEEWGKNREQKEALCVQAEALAESSDWDQTAAALKKLQTDWKAVGPVDHKHSEALWQRFRAACNRFFERHGKRHDLDRAAKTEALEALCVQLEAAASEGPEGLTEKLATLQASWKEAGGPNDPALTARFAAARARVVAAHPDAFRGTDLDPENNRKRMEKLATRMEALIDELLPKRAESTADMVAQLRNALASNTIGGKEAAQEKWQAASTEIDAAREAWQRLGPAGDETAALTERFEKACQRLLSERPPMERPKAKDVPRDRDRDRDRRPKRPRPNASGR